MSKVQEYKCLNCGAGLHFDPPSAKWKCGYCFSVFEKEALEAAYGKDIHKTTTAEEEKKEDLSCYRCASCGVELVTDQTVSATICLYCKSPSIIKERLSGKFEPKFVIPFKLTKDQAKSIYTQWVKKRPFVPDEFLEKEEVDRITGVYAPFWLYDSYVIGQIEGEGTKVSHWRAGDYRYTRTKYYRIEREGTVTYKRVPVDASVKMDDTLMNNIEPYNYSDLKDFSMEYLSGFMAERYDVSSDEGEGIMKKRVERYVEQRLLGTVTGYSTANMNKKNIRFTEIACHYAMLPVYLLVHKYNDKSYMFAVNGQTGKVTGDTPVSLKKQLFFAMLVFLITWLVVVIGGAFLG
jgi:DNA-directed RNA polymerase subunit RPC12/RpoP